MLPDFRGGGVERLSLTLAHQFVRAGHTVKFLVMNDCGELTKEAKLSFSVESLMTDRIRFLPRRLLRFLEKERPDIFLVSMWPLTAIAPVIGFLSPCSTKVFVVEHNNLIMQYSGHGWVQHLFMRLSIAVGYRLAHNRIGVSAGVARAAAALALMRPAQFSVVHNPVPPAKSYSDEVVREAHETWAVEPGARVLCVGSLKAQKNHQLLLYAFAQLPNPEARLIIVGEGAKRDELEALARELCIADRVSFVGFKSDPGPFYQTADLFVLSSDYEGFGNVIVESLAHGTPVVSTNCPWGPSEILNDGEFGHLVPVGNVAALAKAMSDSLALKPDRKILMGRARNFSPEVISGRYLEIFLAGS